MQKVFKDKLRRKFFYKNELNRCKIKQLNKIGIDIEMTKKMWKVRIQNRCILTGKKKSVYRFFKISRMKVRELCSFGFFYGVHKASW